MKNKLLQIKSKLSDNKKRAVAWLLVGSLVLGLAPIPKTTVNAVEYTAPIPEDGGYFTETNTGDMNRVPYNNEDLTVDLSASVFGTVFVGDHDNDNILDIIISTTCKGIPVQYQVCHGKAGSQDINDPNYMVMNKAVAVAPESYKFNPNNQAYGTCIYNTTSGGKDGGYKDTYAGTLYNMSGHMYGDIKQLPWATLDYGLQYGLSSNSSEEEIALFQNQLKDAKGNTVATLMKQGKNPDGSSYSFADYDGDGDLDILYSISTWTDFGWKYGELAYYNDKGVWDSPKDENQDGEEDKIHGFVFWIENTATAEENIGKTLWQTKGSKSNPPKFANPQVIKVDDGEGGQTPLDTYSHPEAQMFDFDNDGDLDIVCGSWSDEITYYENVAEEDELPKFQAGRPFVYRNSEDGYKDIYAEHMLLSIAAVDWNNDGWMDLVVSEEDTRAFLLENTGTRDDNNTPVMKAPQYFQQEADSVKVGVFATPYSIDWDGDGDEDLIYGNSGGFIEYVKNLSKEEGRDLSDPSWAKPVRFEDTTGEVYHITARMEGVYGIDGIEDGSYAGSYGSIQGPVEQKVGLTKISVGYWDEDDILDIMSNNIRGEIYLHKGTEKGSTVLEEAELVKVEWEDDDGDDIPDPKLPDWYNREYDQRKYYAEQGYLITQQRTTPFMIDLPVTDADGDGVAEGDGLTDLVMLDHEGYLAFFERYRDGEELKLKEGKRIFKDTDESALGLRPWYGYDTETGDGDGNFSDGESGRRLFTMVDYDLDGDLDLIVDDQVNRWNIEYRENISTTPGEYKFAAPYSMHTRNYAYHTPCPTVCDWNQDGIPDVLVGTEAGYLYYLKNTVVKTPEESLVAHWDFEGDTQDEMLEDKATAGEAENNLTVKGTTGNVSIKGGVATITGDGYLMTPDQADLDLNGEMTIFMRAFVNGSGGDSATTSLINKGNRSDGYNYSINASDWTHTNFNLECDTSAKRYSSTGYIKEDILPRGEWREIAFVISEEADGYYYQIFLSNAARTGSVEDFEIIKEKTYIGSQIRVNSDDLLLGIESDLTSNTSTRKIDDVRIYNTALTVKQLVTLLPEVNLEENLVAHWDFEGDADTTALDDKSIGGDAKNNLTVNGTTGNVSIKGGVATITGDGYLMTPDQADLDRNGEMTIFIRAFVSGNGGDPATTSLITKGNGDDGYNYSIDATCWGDTNFNLECNTSAKRYTSAGYRKENILPRGEWREIAFVISEEADGYYYQIFLSNAARTGSVEDFEIIKEKTYIGSQIRVNSDDLLLGIESDLTSNTSTRKIDDVRIYNKALTTDQLAKLLPEVNLEDNLVAHWDFEGDPSTTALEDKAAYGIDDNTLEVAGDSGKVTLEDGMARLEDGGWLKAPDAQGKVDLDQAGEATYFMRVYMEENGNIPLIDKASGSYYVMRLARWGSNILNLSTSATTDVEMTTEKTLPTGVWRELAVVVSRNAEGYLEYEILISTKEDTDKAEDFTSMGKKLSTYTTARVTNSAFLIGNNFDDSFTNKATSRFDDVRIYNTALTTEQLAGLITVEEEEYNLDNGAYNLSTVGTNVWVNGEKVTETLLNKSGEYEIAVGTESNLVKRVLLYRPGNANIPVDESTDVIDVRDLVAIIKASDGIELSSKAAKRGADVNGDSKVNDTDKGQLRNMLLK